VTNQDTWLVLSGLPLLNPYVGQGTYAMRLVLGLQRKLAGQLGIVLPSGADHLRPIITSRFVQLPRRPLPNHDLLKQIVLGGQLLRFVAREFPNAIFHSPGPTAGRVRPPRCVVTIHDCIYRSFPYYLGRFAVRRMYMTATERFARQASMVLTDSNFSKAELINRLGFEPDKIEILYPWVGNDFLGPLSQEEVIEARRRYSLPERFWLYLGGYDYRKNVEFLLRAYAQIINDASVPPLVLAGEIPMQHTRVTCNVMGTLRNLGFNEDQVRLPGRIDSEDMPAVYKAASLLIYPSLMEGFGLPPAEAMALGTPILSSNVSSLPEVVQNSDCLFDPRDVQSLAEKLVHASKDVDQFVSPLSEKFTEEFGIRRYLNLIGRLSH